MQISSSEHKTDFFPVRRRQNILQLLRILCVQILIQIQNEYYWAHVVGYSWHLGNTCFSHMAAHFYNYTFLSGFTHAEFQKVMRNAPPPTPNAPRTTWSHLTSNYYNGIFIDTKSNTCDLSPPRSCLYDLMIWCKNVPEFSLWVSWTPHDVKEATMATVSHYYPSGSSLWTTPSAGCSDVSVPVTLLWLNKNEDLSHLSFGQLCSA